MTFIPKYVQFKASKTPQVGSYLSGVVLLSKGGRRSKCYIRFSKDTENYVARQMPYGIGPENAAFIHIVETYQGFDVYCKYVDKSKAVLLWKSDSLPEWVKEYERKEKTAGTTDSNGKKKGKGEGKRGKEKGNAGRVTRSHYSEIQRQN